MKYSFLIILMILVFPLPLWALEMSTRYVTIQYEYEEQLLRFNDEIILGSLSYLMQGRKALTIDEEVRNKVDVIVERVESILEMYPRKLRFRIVLLDNAKEVQRVYREMYGRDSMFIAFYSPKKKTVYLSVRDIELTVLAHELAHVIIDSYYNAVTPVKIHEVLAQYVTEHLED